MAQTYPCLKRRDVNELVVEFTDSTTGTVVESQGTYEVGYHTDNWLDAESSRWIDYTPPTTKIAYRINRTIKI